MDWPMNKKTFALALLFLLATLCWLCVNIYWDLTGQRDLFATFIALIFVALAGAMTFHEFRKKKRRHLDEVNRNQIP